MTYEQMLELAERIKSMLTKEFRTNAEVLEHAPGDAIPISFDHDGEDFVVELAVL